MLCLCIKRSLNQQQGLGSTLTITPTAAVGSPCCKDCAVGRLRAKLIEIKWLYTWCLTHFKYLIMRYIEGKVDKLRSLRSAQVKSVRGNGET